MVIAQNKLFYSAPVGVSTGSLENSPWSILSKNILFASFRPATVVKTNGYLIISGTGIFACGDPDGSFDLDVRFQKPEAYGFSVPVVVAGTANNGPFSFTFAVPVGTFSNSENNNVVVTTVTGNTIKNTLAGAFITSDPDEIWNMSFEYDYNTEITDQDLRVISVIVEYKEA